MWQGKLTVSAKWSKYFDISADMRNRALIGLLLTGCSFLLSGCLTGVWTGASLIYDRHIVYKKISDFQLGANARRILYKDKTFKCTQCAIDVAVFNGDILLAGHVPNAALRQEAQARISSLSGYRRLFNQISISQTENSALQDGWITAKINGQILADAKINPNEFKVVTSDNIVYLMGDVIPAQALRVIAIARRCEGVKRVVKLFKYYHLSDKAS